MNASTLVLQPAFERRHKGRNPANIPVLVVTQTATRLVDLTTKVVEELTYAIAQDSFGDIWKCRFSEKITLWRLVAVKYVKIVSRISLARIAYGFGPVPAIVSPRMPNESSSTYLDENSLQPTTSVCIWHIVHSDEVVHADLRVYVTLLTSSLPATCFSTVVRINVTEDGKEGMDFTTGFLDKHFTSLRHSDQSIRYCSS
ncbi:uncharacterized protein F5147DRAFT_657579 [Suillus discolor]|uniref:Uncharacterized protein n=1 Tax=Suillus discolor TaxID=1912936 RepID=A0A9P7EVK2_9AGAM|nr:uncharacterized protein F5147DRAFT_657579 [Suillus discolor]KAG2092792.1 hypothetical protein F5147DRAFT_657579 [Suillus discolor]